MENFYIGSKEGKIDLQQHLNSAWKVNTQNSDMKYYTSKVLEPLYEAFNTIIDDLTINLKIKDSIVQVPIVFLPEHDVAFGTYYNRNSLREGEVSVHVDSISLWFAYSKNDVSIINKFYVDILVHEMQHALDDYKRKTNTDFDKMRFNYKKKNKITDANETYEKYRLYPWEINASYAQTIYRIIQELEDDKLAFDYKNAIIPRFNEMFDVNIINVMDKKQRNQLYSRLYKDIDEHFE